MSSSLALFESWNDEPAQPVPLEPASTFNRLEEPGVGCQLFTGGERYDSAPLRQCSKFPAAPAKVNAPHFRKDETSCTHMRLCAGCFEKISKRRPVQWLNGPSSVEVAA
jgi:hypothetical protein